MASKTCIDPVSTKKLPGWPPYFKGEVDAKLPCHAATGPLWPIEIIDNLGEENHVLLSQASQDDGISNSTICPNAVLLPNAVSLGESSPRRIEIVPRIDSQATAKTERLEVHNGRADKRSTAPNSWKAHLHWDSPGIRPDDSMSMLLHSSDSLEHSTPCVPIFTPTFSRPPMPMDASESLASSSNESSPTPPESYSGTCMTSTSCPQIGYCGLPEEPQTSLGTTCTSGTSEEPNSGTSERNYDLQMRRPKRPNPEGDPFDEDDTSSRKMRKKDSDRPFACPMYKRDPIQHGHCAVFRLTRIKDVKQHIVRAHYLPYCPRCYLTFTKESLRDHHARERPPCESLDDVPVAWGNLTGQQRSRLATRFDRRGTCEEHWYMIWDILFPGIKRPPSPYLFSLVEETISRVRLFWERQQTPIISSVLGIRSDSNAVTPEMVAHVVNEVLARFAHSQQPTSTHDDSSPEKNVSPLPSCIPNMQDIDTADSGSIWDLDVNDMPLPGQLGPVRFDSIDSGIGSQFDLDETLQNYGNI